MNINIVDSTFHNVESYGGNVGVSNVQILVDWTRKKPSDKEYAPCTDGIDVHGDNHWIHNTVIDVGDDNVAIHANNVVIEDVHFGGASKVRGPKVRLIVCTVTAPRSAASTTARRCRTSSLIRS